MEVYVRVEQQGHKGYNCLAPVGLLIPQFLKGLSMLMLICAQAPQTLQGLLIGQQYAMYPIRYNVLSSWILGHIHHK